MVSRTQSIAALRPTLRLAALACATYVGAVSAGELIKPTIDLNDMRVVVTYVSTGELLILQRRYGHRVDLRDIRQSHRNGLAIVKREVKTGAFTCEIYLPNERLPRSVDDKATLILGHEFLHCLLGDYHE